MKGVKTKLAWALAVVELLTLLTAMLLYVGARRFEEDARGTREANHDLRELLELSLAAHAYMDAFGRSLGQRTLIANRQRRAAATMFESRIGHISTQDHGSFGLDAARWQELQRISEDLTAGLRAADDLRAQGDFLQAERRFAEARQDHFDARMLSWFEAAISSSSSDAAAREQVAQRVAARLRLTGAGLVCSSPLLAALVVLWISGGVLRPVRALVAGAEAIRRGELGHRVKHSGNDEFALVADSFNRMVDTLAATQASLLEKNERLEEAYRMQNEFVSMVTHELRSPLHSIRGYLEFVLEDEPGLHELSKKNLVSIGEGAQRLLRLVNDILDYSKLEAKQLQIEQSRFELNPVLEDALYDARALIQGRPVEIVLEAPEEQVFLDSDYTRLRQILTNLLSNAVKFTEHGRVTLAVQLRAEAVELVVRDNGIGIPAGQLGLIFQPFKQATVGGGSAQGGTGLGLAIVARLAQLIEATVSVRSELGKGSEFTLLVPRRMSKAS
jgi:signal transduction histidine kinase